MRILETSEPMIARSFSFGWYKRVYVGTEFHKLDALRQAAVLAHEQGHLEGHHSELRMLCFLFAPFFFFRLCRHQEYQADLYAMKKGYARQLFDLLKSDFDGGLLQPAHIERRLAIRQYEHQSRFVPVKDHSPGSA